MEAAELSLCFLSLCSPATYVYAHGMQMQANGIALPFAGTAWPGSWRSPHA